MDGGQHRPAQALHKVHQLQLVFDIQVVGGLVQNQTGRLLGQGTGQNDPLLLSA